MLRKSMLSLVCLILICGAFDGTRADETHAWQSISYPELACQFADGRARPSLRVDENKRFRFTLSFSWSDTDKRADGFAPPDGSKISARLHYPDGSIIEPLEPRDDLGLDIVTERRGYFFGSFQCVFPWGKNEMSEAWLEVRLPEHEYWLEIPYGFTRDPDSDSLPVARSGRPQLPEALAPFPEGARIVNWKHVDYNFGEIQNGWRLSLLQSNPFDAQSEMILYRDDMQVGKSMFLWDLHSPRTKISIKHTSGFVLKSRAMSLRLHEDGMRRSDTFDFNRNPGDEELRDWGELIVEVDDRQWTTTVPSSLFRYIHGLAAPNHQSTWR